MLVFDDVARTHRVQLLHNKKWLTLDLEKGVGARDNAWPWKLLASEDAPVRMRSLAPLVPAAGQSAGAPGATGTALDSDGESGDLFADADDDDVDDDGDIRPPSLDDDAASGDVDVEGGSAAQGGEGGDEDVDLEDMLGQGRAPLQAQDLAQRARAVSEKRQAEAMQAEYAKQAAVAAAAAAQNAAAAARQQLQARAALNGAAANSTVDSKVQLDLKMAEYLQQQAEAAEEAAEQARIQALEAAAAKREAAKKRRREAKEERQATAAERKLARTAQKAAARAARRSAAGAVRSASLTAVGSKKAPKFRPAPSALLPAPVPVEDVCGPQGGRLPDALPGDVCLDDIVPAFGMVAPFALSWRFTANEALGNTPSRQDGVAYSLEQQWRRSATALLVEAAVLDAVPLNMALHASVLLQRALAVRSVRGLQHRAAAAAALALAGAASPWHKLSLQAASWTVTRGAVSSEQHTASTPAVYAAQPECASEPRSALACLRAGSAGLEAEAGDAVAAAAALLVACRWDTSVPDLSSIIAQCLGQAVALPVLFNDLGASQPGEAPSVTVRLLAAATIAASAHGRVADWTMHALSAATAGSTVAEVAKGSMPADAHSTYWAAVAGGVSARQAFADACSTLAGDATWRSGLPQVAPLVLNVLSHTMVVSNLITAPQDCLMHTLPAWILGNVYCCVGHLQALLSVDRPEWLLPFSPSAVRLEMTPAGGALPPSMEFPGTYKRTAAAEAAAQADASTKLSAVAVKPPAKPDKAGSLTKGRDAQLGATVLVDVLDVAWATATVGHTLLQPDGAAVCIQASAAADFCARATSAAVRAVLGSCLQQQPAEWGHDVRLPSPEGIVSHAAALIKGCASGDDSDDLPDPLAASLVALRSKAGVATAADGSAKQFNVRAADARCSMRTAREFQFLRSLGDDRYLARDLRFSHLPCLDGTVEGGATCRLVVLQRFEGEPALPSATETSQLPESDGDAPSAAEALACKPPAVSAGKCVDSLQQWATQVSALRNTHGYLGEVGKTDVSGQAAHPMMNMDAPEQQGAAKRSRTDTAQDTSAHSHVLIRGISCRDASAEGVQGIVGGGVGVLPNVKRNAHLAAPLEVVLGTQVAESVAHGSSLPAAAVQPPPQDLETFFSTPVSQGGGKGLLVDGTPQSHLQRHSYVVFDHWAHNLSGLCMDGVLLSAGQQQRLGFQLLRGALRMHQFAYVHGAISPDVVCFARDGMVKLLPRPAGQRSVRDFDLKQVAGILKEIGGSGTRTGQQLLRKSGNADDEHGSMRLPASQLQCMAPELLMGAGFVLPCSDAWSIACVLGHALLGRPLFPGKTRQEVLRSIVATVGPVTKRWPASRYLPLHSLVSGAEFQRSEAKKLQGPVPPPLEELLVKSGVPKACARLLRKMLVVDPAQRPDAKAALHNEYFKAFVPPSKPAVEVLYPGGAQESSVVQRIAGTVLMSSAAAGKVITKTTFRASLPYATAEMDALQPHNAGDKEPDATQLPRVAGDGEGLATAAAAGDEHEQESAAAGDVSVPIDIDPFPYLQPCVMVPSDLAQQSAAEKAAAWSAGLPIALATTSGSSSSGAAAAVSHSTSGFGAGFA